MDFDQINFCKKHGDSCATDDGAAVADFWVKFDTTVRIGKLDYTPEPAKGEVQRDPYLEISRSASASAMPVTWSIL
jgi:hypothetical protein